MEMQVENTVSPTFNNTQNNGSPIEIRNCFAIQLTFSLGKSRLVLAAQKQNNSIFFFLFLSGLGNESCDLVGSKCGPDFSISAHGHGNTTDPRSSQKIIKKKKTV